MPTLNGGFNFDQSQAETLSIGASGQLIFSRVSIDVRDIGISARPSAFGGGVQWPLGAQFPAYPVPGNGRVLFLASAPASSDGHDGDYAIASDSQALYQKTNDTWAQTASGPTYIGPFGNVAIDGWAVIFNMPERLAVTAGFSFQVRPFNFQFTGPITLQ